MHAPEEESGGTVPTTRAPRVRAVPIFSVFFSLLPQFITFLSYILTNLRYGPTFGNFFGLSPKKKETGTFGLGDEILDENSSPYQHLGYIYIYIHVYNLKLKFES